MFRTNVGGTWLWSRAAVPEMQRQGAGSIITLASQLAIAGGKNNSAYIAAKGAIISLTRTMALDFAIDGIRVNAIAPGAIDTPMLRRSFARHADPEPVREASRNPPCHEAIWQSGGSGRGRASSGQRCVFLYDRHRDGGRWRLARGMSDDLVALEAQVRADLARIAHPHAAWLVPKPAPDGKPALDVLVVGAGQSGIATAFGLMRSQVDQHPGRG